MLGLMLIGIAVLIRSSTSPRRPPRRRWPSWPRPALGTTLLFYGIQLITTVLLALAANTSFGGLPVLASLLARDNYLPHMFALQADRQVHRYGISVLAVFAAVLLVVARGDTQALIPVFAIGVFVGFTLSQAGMVRHWHEQHSRRLGRPGVHQRAGRGADHGRAGASNWSASSPRAPGWSSSSSRCWCCCSTGSTGPTTGSVRSSEWASRYPRRSRSRRWWWCRSGGMSRLTREGGVRGACRWATRSSPSRSATTTRTIRRTSSMTPGSMPSGTPGTRTCR